MKTKKLIFAHGLFSTKKLSATSKQKKILDSTAYNYNLACICFPQVQSSNIKAVTACFKRSKMHEPEALKNKLQLSF